MGPPQSAGCSLLQGEQGKRGAHLLGVSGARSERSTYQALFHVGVSRKGITFPPTRPHTVQPANSAAGRGMSKERRVRAGLIKGGRGTPTCWGQGEGLLPPSGTCSPQIHMDTS